MRKPLMAVAIVACLIMTVVGGLVPVLQGWIFFVIALYLLATEFESGRRWVRAARRRCHGSIAGSSGRATIVGHRAISRNSRT
jgi:hypothetical protein